MNSLALRVAVDKVRRQEPKALRAAGDSILTGSKYMWLTNREPMSEKQREQFSENFPGVGPQRNRPESVELCESHLGDQSLTTMAVLSHEMQTYPHPKRGKNDQMSPLGYPECKQRPRRKHQQPHQNREGTLPWISE